MNLRLDVEGINDISFGGRVGSINIDIPDYEQETIISCIDFDVIDDYITDDIVIEMFKKRNLSLD